jgi:hypothetical protein
MIKFCPVGISHIQEQSGITAWQRFSTKTRDVNAQAVFAFFMYIVFSVGHTFAAHGAARVHLHPVVITILAYVLKFVLAICMSGHTVPQLVRLVFSNRRTLCMYIIPAISLAFCDFLSFIILSTHSPAEYRFILRMRLILIAPLWQFLLKKRLSWIQWGLVGVCIWAVVVKQRNMFAIGMVFSHADTADINHLAPVAMQLLLSSVGNIINEKLLVNSPLTVSVQNVIMYGQALCALCAFGGLTFLWRRPVVTQQTFPNVLTTPVILSVICLGSLGVSTAFVLKHLGNVTKELLGMLVLFLVAGIEWWVLRISRCDTMDVEAMMLMSFSIILFSSMRDAKA